MQHVTHSRYVTGDRGSCPGYARVLAHSLSALHTTPPAHVHSFLTGSILQQCTSVTPSAKSPRQRCCHLQRPQSAGQHQAPARPRPARPPPCLPPHPYPRLGGGAGCTPAVGNSRPGERRTAEVHRTQAAAERRTLEGEVRRTLEEERRILLGVVRHTQVEERRTVGLRGRRSRRVPGGLRGRCRCSCCSRCRCAALDHILQARSASTSKHEAEIPRK